MAIGSFQWEVVVVAMVKMHNTEESGCKNHKIHTEFERDLARPSAPFGAGNEWKTGEKNRRR